MRIHKRIPSDVVEHRSCCAALLFDLVLFFVAKRVVDYPKEKIEIENGGI